MKGGPGVGGVRLASLGVVLLLAVLMAGYALAGEFTSEPSPSTYEAQVAPNISFDVTNTDSLYNITNITVIFPSTLEFVTGSSYTNMSNSSISNTATSFMWGNATLLGILPNGSSTYLNLSFHNMTAPGNYSFELNITFTNGSYDNETHNVTIQDTTPPTDIVLLNPDNDTWITASSVWINISFTELNPYNCIYENSTGDNTTNTYSESPCLILVTDYNESTWTYSVWVNDTSGNIAQNGVYYLGYDISDPVGNSLGLFYQGTNVSNGSITELGDVVISVNVTDSLSGINTSLNGSVYANITNSSGYVMTIVNLTHTSGDIFNGTWDADQYSAGGDNYSVNVTATDIAGNTRISAISTALEIVGAPELFLDFSGWTSDNAAPGHPHYGNNLTLNVTIFNGGEEDFDGYVNVTLSRSGVGEIVRTNVSNTSLQYGENYTVEFTVLSGNFSGGNGYYLFTAEVDPASENAVEESSENNNTGTFGLTLGYNVSLNKINNGSVSSEPPDIANAFPDRNVTFNISVTYANGDPVSGITAENLTFTNTPHSEGQEDNSTLGNRNAIDFIGCGSGFCVFNFTTHPPTYEAVNENGTRADPGLSTMSVSISDGGNYTGSGGFDYNLTAPDLTVLIWGNGRDNVIGDIDLAGSSSKWVEFNITVTNNGNAPAYDILIDDPDDWLYDESVFEDLDSDGDISLSALNPDESHIFPGAGKDLEIKAIGLASGSDENLYVTVHYNDSVDNEYEGFDYDKVGVGDTGSGEEEEENGGTTDGGDLELELTLTDWDDEIDGYPGGSNTTRVKVKNTGDVTVVAKVSFTCDVVEDDPTIGPISKSLAVGTSQEFIIDFNIEDDAEIGEYDCTAKAYVSSSEDDYDTGTIVLRVLATGEVAEEINQSCQNLSATIDGLFDRFSLINRALVNDTNLSRVENLLNTANITLQDILDAIGDGDYITAHDLIESLNTSLGSIEDGLYDLELEQSLGGGLAFSGQWFWFFIIIVVVIAVAFVAYLLFPQKGYGPRKSITDTLKDTIRIGASRAGEIKEKGKSLGSGRKEPFRPSGYAGGYEKQAPPAAYGYRKGPAGKIKGAFSRLKEKLKRRKKPQKEVTQYFASSSSNIINYS